MELLISIIWLVLYITLAVAFVYLLFWLLSMIPGFLFPQPLRSVVIVLIVWLVIIVWLTHNSHLHL